MKGKHAQKNFGALGAMAPTPLSLETRGGGGGGWGVSHTRTGPAPAPLVRCRLFCISSSQGQQRTMNGLALIRSLQTVRMLCVGDWKAPPRGVDCMHPLGSSVRWLCDTCLEGVAWSFVFCKPLCKFEKSHASLWAKAKLVCYIHHSDLQAEALFCKIMNVIRTAIPMCALCITVA